MTTKFLAKRGSQEEKIITDYLTYLDEQGKLFCDICKRTLKTSDDVRISAFAIGADEAKVLLYCPDCDPKQ